MCVPDSQCRYDKYPGTCKSVCISEVGSYVFHISQGAEPRWYQANSANEKHDVCLKHAAFQTEGLVKEFTHVNSLPVVTQSAWLAAKSTSWNLNKGKSRKVGNDLY